MRIWPVTWENLLEIVIATIVPPPRNTSSRSPRGIAGLTRAIHLSGMYKSAAPMERSSSGIVKVRLLKVGIMCKLSPLP